MDDVYAVGVCEGRVWRSLGIMSCVFAALAVSKVIMSVRSDAFLASALKRLCMLGRSAIGSVFDRDFVGSSGNDLWRLKRASRG